MAPKWLHYARVYSPRKLLPCHHKSDKEGSEIASSAFKSLLTPVVVCVSKPSLHHCTVGLKLVQKQSGGSSANTALRQHFLARCLYEVLYLQAGRSPGLLMTLLMNNHRQIFSREINVSRKGQL